MEVYRTFMRRNCLKLLLLVVVFVSCLCLVQNLVYLITMIKTSRQTKIFASNRHGNVFAYTNNEMRVHNAGGIDGQKNVQTEAAIPENRAFEKNNSEPNKGLDGENDVPCDWMKTVTWRPEYDRHNFDYLISPANPCVAKTGPGMQSSGRNVSVLILVASGLGNIARRDAQRRTWIRWSIEQGLPTRTLFLLGASPDRKLMDDVRKESEIHGDIVQEDFIDAYYNLTLKTIMAFKWAATSCRDSVDFVMKMDDDTVLNVGNLVRDLANAPPEFRTNYFAGGRRTEFPPLDNPTSKWCIPRRLFPDLPDIYSPFPLGAGYVMTPDVAEKLYQRSQVSRHFPLEDVYVGMLLKELGLNLRHRSTFVLALHFSGSGGTYIANEYSLQALIKGYLTWDITPKTVDLVWNAILTKSWPPHTRYRDSDCKNECLANIVEFLP